MNYLGCKASWINSKCVFEISKSRLIIIDQQKIEIPVFLYMGSLYLKFIRNRHNIPENETP